MPVLCFVMASKSWRRWAFAPNPCGSSLDVMGVVLGWYTLKGHFKRVEEVHHLLDLVGG